MEGRLSDFQETHKIYASNLKYLTSRGHRPVTPSTWRHFCLLPSPTLELSQLPLFCHSPGSLLLSHCFLPTDIFFVFMVPPSLCFLRGNVNCKFLPHLVFLLCPSVLYLFQLFFCSNLMKTLESTDHYGSSVFINFSLNFNSSAMTRTCSSLLHSLQLFCQVLFLFFNSDPSSPTTLETSLHFPREAGRFH